MTSLIEHPSVKRRSKATVTAPVSGKASDSDCLPRPHRFTVQEIEILDEAGTLSHRIELLDGSLFEISPIGNPHGIAVNDLYDILRTAWPKPGYIRNQQTHRFTKHDAPEPDLAILDAYPAKNAVTDELPRLVVEVSDTTLAMDLVYKKLAYAKFSVPEYWVLDLQGRRLFVFRDPNPESADAIHAWRDEQILSENGTVSPICIAELTINVADLLPEPEDAAAGSSPSQGR